MVVYVMSECVDLMTRYDQGECKSRASACDERV